MDNYTVVLNLLYNNPFTYIEEMADRKYAEYLNSRLTDILSSLTEEKITIDIRCFRKFMCFSNIAFKKEIDLTGFTFFIAEDGSCVISNYTPNREKYLFIAFKRDWNFYGNKQLEVHKTSGFTKLIREIKSFQK